MSTQGPEAKGKDLLSRVGKTIKAGAATIFQETKDLTKIGKLKLELMSLEDERGRKFEEIGTTAHALYKTGATMPADLHRLLGAVDGILARIEAKNIEIENVRVETEPRETPQDKTEAPVAQPAEPGASLPPSAVEPSERKSFCQECGARLSEGDVFCSRCGTRV